MRAIDYYIAIGNTGFADNGADLAGNVNHLITVFTVDAKVHSDDFHNTITPNL